MPEANSRSQPSGSAQPSGSEQPSSATDGDASGGNTPGGNTPGGNTPGGNTPGGNTPGGNTPTRNLPARAEPKSSDLAEADQLFREDLFKEDLFKEDLFRADLDTAARYFEESLAEATRRAYRTAWARFAGYCASRGRTALPAAPETIAGYLSRVAPEYAASTLRQHVAAIRHVHRRRYPNEVSPTKSALVENVLAGIVRAPGDVRAPGSARSPDQGSSSDHSSSSHARSNKYSQPNESGALERQASSKANDLKKKRSTMKRSTMKRSTKRRRSRGIDKAEPLRTRHLKAILPLLPGTGPAPAQADDPTGYATWLRGLRDRALLLAGFAGALRRSELSRMQVEDLTFKAEGYLIYIGRSKTDQTGAGEEVAIAAGENAATCPAQAMRRWLAAAGIDAGPVFRGVRRSGYLRPSPLTGRSISTIVKGAADLAGLAAGRIPGSLEKRRFSGHSLRAGHITEATSRGAPGHLVMQQSRHKDRKTFDGYVRPERLMATSSSRHLGL